VIVQLAAEGTITRIEVDTAHFKGNFPESCAVQVGKNDGEWHEVLARTKLQADTRHFYEAEILPHAPATHARLQIFPDGGVSRLRLFGEVSPRGREAFGVTRLNLLSKEDAERELLACCGARRWAAEVAKARPFMDLAALKDTARRAWSEAT
jgi:allantoicase